MGFTVRTTAEYSDLIVHKHPEIRGHLQGVQQWLAAPQQVRQSKRDRIGCERLYDCPEPGDQAVTIVTSAALDVDIQGE